MILIKYFRSSLDTPFTPPLENARTSMLIRDLTGRLGLWLSIRKYGLLYLDMIKLGQK